MFEKVVSIMENVLNIDGADITEATDFKDDLGLDSLDIVELLLQLEEEYGIHFDDVDMTNITTVQDLLDAIEAQLNK